MIGFQKYSLIRCISPFGIIRREAGTGRRVYMQNLIYDALWNLLSETGPQNISYVVDPRGRRVGRKVNGALVQGFLYGGQLSPVAELDGLGAVVSRFVYGSRANVPEYMIQRGANYKMITDHVGSVRLVVNASTGAVVSRIDYDVWGNITASQNLGSLISNISDLRTSSTMADWADSNWTSFRCEHGEWVYWQKGSGGDATPIDGIVSKILLEDVCRIDRRDDEQVIGLFGRHAGILGKEERGYFGQWLLNRIVEDPCGACSSKCSEKTLSPEVHNIFSKPVSCSEEWCQIMSKTAYELQSDGWKYPPGLFDSRKKQLAPGLLLEPVCDTKRVAVDELLKTAPKLK